MKGEVFITLWASNGDYEPPRASISPESPLAWSLGNRVLFTYIFVAERYLRVAIFQFFAKTLDIQMILQLSGVFLQQIYVNITHFPSGILCLYNTRLHNSHSSKVSF